MCLYLIQSRIIVFSLIVVRASNKLDVSDSGFSSSQENTLSFFPNPISTITVKKNLYFLIQILKKSI